MVLLACLTFSYGTVSINVYVSFVKWEFRLSRTPWCMKINNLWTNVFSRLLLTCQHLFGGSESKTKNDFAFSVAGAVSSSFSLQARRRAATLSAVSPHPAVPHSARLHQWSALTGAKQRCFRTCRGLVKRRWVWKLGKRATSKNIVSHVLLFPRAVTSRSRRLEH